jgi:drug/metabolite transporter superfamily protein YnfA
LEEVDLGSRRRSRPQRSLGWLWLAEGTRPDRRDLVGAGIALLGTLVILLGPRAST